ncbi:excisionase [Paucibacter sp. M5-1]|uniref:excisionase n=1 Tax=Paucibacter sp. M5-1 TaxID=3015998 RepID=UPI0022B88FE2|nr:excisionase [Paucibacter sp. M5-1]MCZ7883779.1 excisionase [Paucibacter sp. M5-1]
MLHWVRLSKYCELSGETPDAVSGRLRAGKWLRDIHARQPEGSSGLWVNLRAVNDWAEGKLPAQMHGQAVGKS